MYSSRQAGYKNKPASLWGLKNENWDFEISFA